jgi:hypothetical protein
MLITEVQLKLELDKLIRGESEIIFNYGSYDGVSVVYQGYANSPTGQLYIIYSLGEDNNQWHLNSIHTFNSIKINQPQEYRVVGSNFKAY